jgi:hypothetical protein
MLVIYMYRTKMYGTKIKKKNCLCWYRLVCDYKQFELSCT